MIKTEKKIIATIIIACLISLLVIPTSADDFKANMMKLLKTQGTVAVIDKNERSVSLFKGMKLQNGYEVATAQASYAWINLDDTKLVKLDALTNVGVEQIDKALNLTLNSGKIIVDVSKKLEADETLNIKTGNVITGVRGTLFTIEADEPYFDNTESVKIVVLEGKVSATIADPATGKAKELIVEQGNKAECSINASNPAGTVRISKATAKDLDGFSALELALNPAMRNRALVGSPDIILPSLNSSLLMLGNDIVSQAQYIDNLSNLRGKGVEEAVWYKVGIRMNIYGQISDGQYVSGINPNTGAPQFVWETPNTGSRSYSEGSSGSSGSGSGSSEDGPADAGTPSDTPSRTPSSSNRGADGGGGLAGGEFD